MICKEHSINNLRYGTDLNKTPLQHLNKFTQIDKSIDFTLWLYLSNIIYYKANKDICIAHHTNNLIDKEIRDKEATIKQWNKQINKNICDMKYIEIRYIYDYEYKGETRTGSNSFYYTLPTFHTVEPYTIKEEAIKLKDKILDFENGLTKGYYKNRNIHTISIGIAPRKEIIKDDKGREKAGNTKTATAFNYFLIDIDIDEWKKANYEPTEQEINNKITQLLNHIPEKYPPYIIAYTGGGLRFKWYFDRPITKLEIPIIKKIAEDLRGKTNLDIDLEVYDIARVDRIIGTYNRKAKYGAPRLSKILYYTSKTGYNLTDFYKAMGYDIKTVLNIIEAEKEKTSEDIQIEAINKIKRTGAIKEYKALDKETLNKTQRIQQELYNHSNKEKDNNNYDWIIKLLDYLGVGYKTIGGRIHIYSLYCDDGANPDAAIYINKGYNAIVKDFHLSTSFYLVSYLWGVYGDKILEYINNLGLSYSLEDTQETIKVIDDFFRLDTEKIPIERYIKPKQIKTILSAPKRIIGIKAPTGAGKTTALINYAVEHNKKIIFLVPYYSMALQQAIKNRIKGFIGLHQDHEESEETIKKANKIIATYDQLYKIISIKGVEELNDYILVIDEYHNLITQYDLRYKAINTILNFKEAFNKILYVSGTYEGLNIENIPIYEYKPQHQRKNNYNIHICKNKIGLEHLKTILKGVDTTKGKYLVFINNIDKIQHIKEELQGEGIQNIHIITALNKDTPIMEELYQKEQLKGTGIYLTTSVICDGINILDKDIRKIIIYDVNDIYQIVQYIARVRAVEPDIIHIIEPQKIKDMELYSEYIKSIRKVITPIIDTINNKRREAIKTGINLKDYKNKDLKRLPIYEEEKYIKFNKLTNFYDMDIFKMTGAYIERLNKRILTNPKAIKEVLLKFYPFLNISTQHIKEEKETTAIEDSKRELANIIINYDYDTIIEVLKSRSELKAMDKTGITYEEYQNIKEIAGRHRKAINRIGKEREYNTYNIGIEPNKEELNKIIEKYKIKDIPEEKKKEVYLLFASPRSINKDFKILNVARAIILDKRGEINKDGYIIEEWNYKYIKIIIDEIVRAYSNNKNIDIPTVLKGLKGLPKPNDKTKREMVIDKIKEYAKFRDYKKIINKEKETITIEEVNKTILEAYYREETELKEINKTIIKEYTQQETTKDYLKELKKYTGEKLHEEDILKILDNNRNLLRKYIREGYIHNIRSEIYLIDV